ncbi:MAG: hypothetical protein C0417_06120 [Chlorobiaceae bacterium]|nr:hypothetical protein [Chlorobiaceae bacterium]
MKNISPIDTKKIIREVIEEHNSSRIKTDRPSKALTIREVNKFSKRDRDNEFLVQGKVIQLMQLLLKYEYFPEVYLELYECLCKYTHPKTAIRFELFSTALKDFVDRIEPKKVKRRIEILEGKIAEINKKYQSTKEFQYNKWCELFPYPSMTYRQLHKELERELSFSPTSLRKYKERRKKSTSDFREDLPISNKDVKEMEIIFINNDWRLPKNNLMKFVKWDKNKVEMILQKMSREGKISYSKSRTDTGIVDVIVMNSYRCDKII